MGNENGEWIMRGLPESDPTCLHTPQELLAYIDKVGFLPLFRNEVPGFSVEEHTAARYWWTDDPRDPWAWRQELSRSGKVAYGKFFDKKAGYVSLAWLPRFVNYRRDGYDFDSRWEEGLAAHREKKIMDLFANGEEHFSNEVKQLAGFGKGGEKNFEGAATDLQMRTYLTVRDFRQRLNKAGDPYGWAIAVYTAPETVWGYDAVTAAYAEAPAESYAKILAFLREQYPTADDKALRRLLK